MADEGLPFLPEEIALLGHLVHGRRATREQRPDRIMLLASAGKNPPGPFRYSDVARLYAANLITEAARPGQHFAEVYLTLWGHWALLTLRTLDASLRTAANERKNP